MKIDGRSATITPSQPAKIAGGHTVSQDASGHYTLNLSDKGNKVELSQGLDGFWKVDIDGKSALRLSPRELEKLTINGNGGDDVITVKNGQLTKPLTINGGAGSDTVRLGVDAAKNTFVDSSLVKFDPGRGVGDKDTFEYYARGKVTAREGEALPSRVFTKTTEVYQ